MKKITTGALLVGLACLASAFGAGFAIYLRPAEASRNSAGTFALSTPGVPFQSNQVISSTQVNNTFTDIASTLTDSLDRNGKGGMLAALRGIDGTLAAPAFSYTSETGSGYFRNAAGDVRMSILGALVGQWTANGLRVASGVVATPGLSFTAETNSGFYRNAANDIRLAVNGADVTAWGASGITSAPLLIYGTGQTSATPTTASSLGGALILGDAGLASGNGGMLVFAANTSTSRYAAIKGFFTDGTSNSVGDILLSTRSAAADATLTERLRIVGGTAGGVKISTGIAGDGSGFKHKRFGATCSTAAVAFATCDQTLTWTTTFADTSYTPTCSCAGISTGEPTIIRTLVSTAAAVSVRVMAITAVAASCAAVYCVAVHD